MKRRREDLDQSHEEQRLEKDTESPGTYIRKRLSFVDDSDTEILIDNQAFKRRKMSKEVEELKVYFAKAIEGLSTKGQSDAILSNLMAHSTQIAENKATGEKNAKDIGDIKHAVYNIERNMMGTSLRSEGVAAEKRKEMEEKERKRKEVIEQ